MIVLRCLSGGLILCIVLTGCLPAAVITGLEVAASTASLSNNVLGIDVSLQQDSKTKSPILHWLKEHWPW